METKSDDLPIILTLRKFPFIPSFDEQFSRKFTTLKKSDPLIPLNEFLTTHCQSVKALICVGGGVKKKDIAVCNAGTVYSEDIAEFAVGLLLDVLRRISSADRFVRSGFWPVEGKFPRVGIVGLGSIGSEVAKRLE
ncbi:hypothetical protein MKW92_043600, partial [Papaver armeniacum]